MTIILWIVLGAVLLSALQAGVRQLRMPKLCSWCRSASGHEVTGHTTEQCQGPQRAAQQRAEIDAAHQHQLKRAEQRLTRLTEQHKTEQEATVLDHEIHVVVARTRR